MSEGIHSRRKKSVRTGIYAENKGVHDLQTTGRSLEPELTCAIFGFQPMVFLASSSKGSQDLN